jgi:hypothetical protein
MFRENGPRNPRKLVGKRACNDIRVSSTQHRANPFSKPVVTLVHALYDGTRALHKQMTQMFVTAFADAT